MAMPKSPVTAKTGNSRIQPIGQTTSSKFGVSDSPSRTIAEPTEAAPLGS